MIENRDLKKRIIEISFKRQLSHLGSCLSAVSIINDIYENMEGEDVFVLSSGHAGLALYVVLEKFEGLDAEELFEEHGVHPNRDTGNYIYASSGSLGHGLPIAIGMAFANKERNVHCLISDGECAEGSIAEAIRIYYENQLTNLQIYLNFNGYGAYKEIEELYIMDPLSKINIAVTNVDELPFLKGIDAHYHVMDEQEYKQALKVLS